MPPTLQAAIAIVAFFAVALVLARRVRSFGTAMFAIAIGALLGLALVVQALTESQWVGYVALALAVLAAISRFAFEAALWSDDRRRRGR